MGEFPIERGFPASVWRGDVVMLSLIHIYNQSAARLRYQYQRDVTIRGMAKQNAWTYA